ncbi:MerR family transcriptional regulator [Chloroflexi bacterium TSY]|nr:MerR family transcriptional regulator [Chloroflexi bacterium TSY]
MFLAGEFSKISRVSKRLLHYYDDIGLFKPAHIDQMTGYRYYSSKQLPALNRILALRDLGLTLEQITKMLQAEISNEEIQGMLLMKKAEMEQAVLDDLQRLRQIEARLEQNTVDDDVPDVVIKSIPAQPYLSVRTIFSTPEELMEFVDRLLHVVPASIPPSALGSFAGVFHAEDFRVTNNDVELGYLLKRTIQESVALSDDHVLCVGELPAVETMATSEQVAGPDLEFLALGQIAQWIEANGYRIAGPYREIGFDVSNVSDLNEAVIEIQMPVENAGPISFTFW